MPYGIANFILCESDEYKEVIALTVRTRKHTKAKLQKWLNSPEETRAFLGLDFQQFLGNQGFTLHLYNKE